MTYVHIFLCSTFLLGAQGDQKYSLKPLELELLEMVVNCLTWVLGTKPRFSSRAAHPLNCSSLYLDKSEGVLGR